MSRIGLAIIAAIATAIILAALGIFPSKQETTAPAPGSEQAAHTDTASVPAAEPEGESGGGTAADAGAGPAEAPAQADGETEPAVEPASATTAEGSGQSGERAPAVVESPEPQTDTAEPAPAGEPDAGLESAPAAEQAAREERDRPAADDVAGAGQRQGSGRDPPAGDTASLDDGSNGQRPSGEAEASSGPGSDNAGPADESAPSARESSAPAGESARSARESSAPAGEAEQSGVDASARSGGQAPATGASSRSARESARGRDEAARAGGSGSASTPATGGQPEQPLPESEPAAVVGEPAGSGVAQEGAALQREAESFVAELAQSSEEPLAVEQLDTFVGSDRPLSPGSGTGAAPPADAPASGGVSEAGPAPAAPARPETPADPAARAATGATRTASGPDAAPPAAAAAGESSAKTPAQSRVDLPLSEEPPVTIAELLGAEEVVASDAVFYVHTVTPDDSQGIWGIVHHGIVNNFAAGVAMNRGGTLQTYRVDIPKHADEVREDNSSSFLGRLIHDKSQRSYVYNFRTERLGQNPDLILPGQEIVIVQFTPEELISIYKHFVSQEGS